MDLTLSKLIRKFKEGQNDHKDIYSLDACDISSEGVLPNGAIFDNTSNKIVYTTTDTSLVDTDEKFYKGGIIDTTFFKEPEISLETKQHHERKLHRFNLFPQKLCDYNWLLAFGVCFNYAPLLCKFGTGRDSSNKTNINILNLGNGKGGFMAGIYYYFKQSHISHTNHLTSYELNWFGVDVKNNTEYAQFKRLSKYYYKLSNHIIHGFTDDNMLDYKNVQYVKSMVENKFNNTNIIFNNINPIGAKIKILVSGAIMSELLHKDGIFITRILEPDYWDGPFVNYLILLALTFNKTEIFRFPVCKNGEVYFRYYLVGIDRKKLLYKNMIYRKLVLTLKNTDVECPKLVDTITGSDEVKSWVCKVNDLRAHYLNSESEPIAELHGIIDKLKDVL
jgi:hypothetical protein